MYEFFIIEQAYQNWGGVPKWMNFGQMIDAILNVTKKTEIWHLLSDRFEKLFLILVRQMRIVPLWSKKGMWKIRNQYRVIKQEGMLGLFPLSLPFLIYLFTSRVPFFTWLLILLVYLYPITQITHLPILLFNLFLITHITLLPLWIQEHNKFLKSEMYNNLYC